MSLIEFINNNVYLVGATLFVFLLALFNELKIKESNICGLTPMEAVKLINNNALIYDLRGPIDFQNKHLLNATNIKSSDLIGQPSNNKTPVLLVCESGGLSKKTSLSLRSKNLENVFYIKGGQLEWENSSLPCSSEPKTKE